MYKSILLKTFVFSFCCALPFTAIYGMEEENGCDSHSARALASRELELPAEIWSNVFGRLPLNDQILTVPLVCQFFKSASEDTLKSAADSFQRQLATRSGNVSISHLKRILKEDENSPPYLTLKSGCKEGVRLQLIFAYGDCPIMSSVFLHKPWREKNFPEFTLRPDSRVVLRQRSFPRGAEKKYYFINLITSHGKLERYHRERIWPIPDSPRFTGDLREGPMIGETVIIIPGTRRDIKYAYRIEEIKDPQKDL